MRVVTVCTANLCRSPFAAAVLHGRLAARGFDVEVASTGVGATAGYAPPTNWLDVAAEFGVDLAEHRSQPPELVLPGADLVLTMTAEHLRSLVVAWPELVGRATTIGLAAASSTADGLVVPQRALDVLVVPNDRDVTDPVGRPRRVQRAVAAHLVELCTWLARAWPGAPS
jgi:protein-tyrosine phosphatase